MSEKARCCHIILRKPTLKLAALLLLTLTMSRKG